MTRSPAHVFTNGTVTGFAAALLLVVPVVWLLTHSPTFWLLTIALLVVAVRLGFWVVPKFVKRHRA